MRIRVFTAPRMAEAMAMVRSELGADAVILGSRRTSSGVEVTAALVEAGLGLDDDACRRLGIDIYKVGMVWPLALHDAMEFVKGKREILVEGLAGAPSGGYDDE